MVKDIKETAEFYLTHTSMSTAQIADTLEITEEEVLEILDRM